MPASERARLLRETCAALRLPMNDKRDTVIRVLSEMDDHPDGREIHRRVCAVDPRISIATIYRTLKIFEEAGLLNRHDFGGQSGRFEFASGRHYHIIDQQNGKIVDFDGTAFDALLKRIAAEMGYDLLDYRLELYGEPDAAPGITSGS